MGRVTDDWTEDATPAPVPREPTVRTRSPRPTFSGDRGKIIRYTVMILGFVVAQIPAYQQSCEAKDKADDAAERVEPVAAKATKTDVAARETDAELDRAYDALARHLQAIDEKLIAVETRADLLERFLARSPRTKYRPARIAKKPPPPPLPPTPAAAPDIQEAR